MLEDIFRDYSEKILVYIGLEVVDDPYSQETSETLMNSIPIRAIVSDMTPNKIQYAMPGITTDKAKEILIEKKYRPIIELSSKIKIGTDYYEGWKVNSKMQIQETDSSYCRIFVYIKKYD